MKVIIGTDENNVILSAVTDRSALGDDLLDMVRGNLVVRMVDIDRVTIGSKYEAQSERIGK